MGRSGRAWRRRSVARAPRSAATKWRRGTAFNRRRGPAARQRSWSKRPRARQLLADVSHELMTRLPLSAATPKHSACRSFCGVEGRPARRQGDHEEASASSGWERSARAGALRGRHLARARERRRRRNLRAVSERHAQAAQEKSVVIEIDRTKTISAGRRSASSRAGAAEPARTRAAHAAGRAHSSRRVTAGQSDHVTVAIPRRIPEQHLPHVRSVLQSRPITLAMGAEPWRRRRRIGMVCRSSSDRRSAWRHRVGAQRPGETCSKCCCLSG